MNIVQISESRGWSGGCEQMFMVSVRLAQRGHKLIVVCPPDGELYNRMNAAGLDVRPLIMRQDYDVFAARRLVKLIRDEKIQLIHANHPRSHAVALFSRYLGAKAKLVVTRRVSFPVSINFFSRIKYTSQQISGFIAVSEAVGKCLRDGGLEPSRVAVIPSGIDLKRFYPRDNGSGLSLRRSFGIGDGVPVVGCVANLSEWKGQSQLVEAARLCLQQGLKAHYLFAGSNTDSPEFKQLVRSAGIDKHVTLAGFRTDVPDILSVMSVCVCPAIRGEGLAGVLREALAQEVPVIATDVGGNGELIINGRTGLLAPPASPSALAGAIAEIISNPALAKEMALAGKKLVEERYDINKIVQSLERFYLEIIT